MRISIPSPLLIVLIVATMPPCQAAPVTSNTLLQADAARVKAMVASDFSTLDRLLGDDLTYVHSTGQIQSKPELLRSLRSGDLHYQSITPAGVKARIYGAAGVVTATATMQVGADGKSVSVSLRYTATYIHEAGEWRLVAYESTVTQAHP